MAVFNSLTIGGINSLDYGIYITGEGVYDAPNRAVEMVEIHGRNGALILDKGHFENIEIKYPCGSFGESGKTFEQRITEFKNAVLSLKGYQRLTDTYATDVYRLASCANGFEVAPVQGGKAGEFDLVFNCKPQRFLTSGETLVTVANNGTIINPTQFDSQPVIQANGYGTFGFNGYEVTIENAVMGETDIVESFTTTQAYLNTSLFNTGDTITVKATIGYQFVSNGVFANSFSLTSGTSGTSIKTQGTVLYVTFPATFTAGTAATSNPTATVNVSIKGTSTTESITISPTIRYYISSQKHIVSVTSSQPSSSTFTPARIPQIGIVAIADSTVSILGTPTVIDCELGEAYKVVNNQFISLNAYIDLGSDLPTLASGANTFTKSNTITSLKVKPNWWKL